MPSCVFVKSVVSVVLGTLLRLDPVLAPVGLGFADLAPPIAATWPFNKGTGFYVTADGLFVAPNHVMGRCPRPALQTPDGIMIGEVIAASAALDVAVARSTARPAHVAQFARESNLAIGQPLSIVRYRGCGGPDSRDILAATALPAPQRATTLFPVSAAEPIRGGNSGSPVVDMSGRVVGMIVARAGAEAHTGFAVDGPTLKGFLLGAGVDIDIAPERLPMAGGLAGAVAARFTYPVVCVR